MKAASQKIFISRIFPFLFFLLPFTFFLFKGCERNFSPYGQGVIQLTAEYVAVTEAWLRVQVDRLPSDGIITLIRNDSLVYRGTLLRRDTTLLDSGLAPNAAYRYRAALWQGGRQVGLSPPITVTTMDTTSHDFVWEVVEFPSPFGSGVLYDVAIINENDIWAVGEIYADSSKPWLPYNAVHWDGQRWELRRIYFYLCPNGTSPTPYPIQAIFAFSQDDIWFTRGGSIVHWDGSNFIHDCSINSLINGSIYKLWGTDSNNLYAVGANGTIVHYDGESWQRIESGTEQYLQDVWGVVGRQSGGIIVYIAASHPLGYGEEKILKITNQTDLDTVWWPFDRRVMSVWTDRPGQLFTCGAGIFRLSHNQRWREIGGIDVVNALTRRIRGMSENDIFAVGAFGAVVHFNGLTFKVYPEVAAALYRSCDYKNNLMVAVGSGSSRAVVLKMWR